jgi:hypothetical protein
VAGGKCCQLPRIAFQGGSTVNIAAHVRIRRRRVLHLLAVIACVVLAAGAPTAASAMVTGSGSPTAPWIQSDQADYPPGATVTLDGGGWSAGEGVHIVVDDTNGHTWHFSDDVTADSDGAIQSSFALPDAFISNYDVTATGAVSGTATTTFLDTNVNVKTAGVASATVDWVRFNTTDCSGSAAASGQITATSGGNGASLPGGATTSQSLRLTAGAVSGTVFTSWSGGTVPSPPNSANPICIAGDNPTQQITATYTAVTTRTTSTALARTTGTNPATYGSSLVYTATVTAPGGNPSNVGTVTFRNGTTVLCDSVPLAGGAATCSPSLRAGGASLTAAYSGGVSGSVQFTSSTSSALAQTVTQKNLTILGAVAQAKTYDASTMATVDFQPGRGRLARRRLDRQQPLLGVLHHCRGWRGPGRHRQRSRPERRGCRQLHRVTAERAHRDDRAAQRDGVDRRRRQGL